MGSHPPATKANPLVSIVIPCYNGEAFLQDAIESALTQSYGNVEVVVVDDGSTDNSPEIAQRFTVRYIRQRHSGLSEARNTGIRESGGSYIVFLDADDRLRPKAVEIGLKVLSRKPECALAIGNHCFIWEDGSFKGDSRKRCLSGFYYEALLRSNFIEMISSVLFRREVLREVGGFDTNLLRAEDYELYLRIARSYGMCSHPAVVAEYRMHRVNASHNSELMLTMTLKVLRRQAQFVRSDPTRLRALRKGVRTWQRQYGRQLAAELARSLPRLSFGDAMRKCFLLACEYPQGLLALMLLRMFGSLRNRRMDVRSGQAAAVDKGSIFRRAGVDPPR